MFTMVKLNCRFFFFTAEKSIIERSPTEKEEDLILLKYLSGLKLKEGEEEELLPPDEQLPSGFRIIYKRRCRRTLFSNAMDKDFAIIVSKETACTSDGKNEDKVHKSCF